MGFTASMSSMSPNQWAKYINLLPVKILKHSLKPIQTTPNLLLKTKRMKFYQASITFHTNLILRDAVNTHGGDGREHHSNGDQAEDLAGDGVPWVLQRKPQTLPDVPVTNLLEMLHVSARVEGEL